MASLTRLGTGMPCDDGCDELSLQVNLVVLECFTMADSSKSPLRSCARCSFSLTWDSVYSRSVAGIRFILLGVEETLKLHWGRVVVNVNACLSVDALGFM